MRRAVHHRTVLHCITVLVYIIIRFYYYPKQTKSAQQKTIQIYIYILIYLNSLISTIGKDIDTSVQIDTKKYDYHLFEFEEKSEKI